MCFANEKLDVKICYDWFDITCHICFGWFSDQVPAAVICAYPLPQWADHPVRYHDIKSCVCIIHNLCIRFGVLNTQPISQYNPISIICSSPKGEEICLNPKVLPASGPPCRIESWHTSARPEKTGHISWSCEGLGNWTSFYFSVPIPELCL